MPVCPVCAYPKLAEPPRSKSGGGSYEICPCCGFQFGVDDDDNGMTFAQWRKRWIADGAKWWSGKTKPPAVWNAEKQLATMPKAKKKAAKKTASKKAAG